jgi:4'-phosphopantetheinyl transferase
MVDILFTYFDKELSSDLQKYYLSSLTPDLQFANSRFKRWQDRQANLMGKLLLIDTLKRYGYDCHALKNLKYNEYGKPYLEIDIDFNISHSGGFVFCASSASMKVGIDIEEVRPIKFDDYLYLFTPSEKNDILKHHCPNRKFFQYWAIKESVLKAEGLGLSGHLEDIKILNNQEAIRHGIKWFLKEIHIDSKYASFIATSAFVEASDVRFFDRNFFDVV